MENILVYVENTFVLKYSLLFFCLIRMPQLNLIGWKIKSTVQKLRSEPYEGLLI